eukprot:g2102.t1
MTESDSPTLSMLEKAIMRCARRRPSMELKEDPQEVSQLPVFLGNRQVLSRQPPVPREKTEKTKWACMVDTDSPSSGSGEPCLTCRMLAFLKSLSRVLTWQEGEVRGEMPAYEMLAVPKERPQLGGDSADELIEKHRFRQAYELLCRMRPCFEPDEGAAGTVTQAESSPKKKVAEVVPSRPAVSAPQCQEIAPCLLRWGERQVPERPVIVMELFRGTSEEAKRRSQEQRSGRMDATSPAIHRGVPPSARLPSTSAGETKAKAAGRHEKSAAGQGGGKYLCRVKVGIEEDVTFQVCRRIIGPGGENMKRIIESTGNGSVKIRLRGRGSKYLEGPEHKESNDDLMLCVSATNRRSFEKAASLVEGLITSVQQDYVAFCQARRLPVPSLSVRREAQRSR